MMQYGDEIGMGDDLTMDERECARTPMQWTNEPRGGFSRAERPVRPVISDAVYGYEKVNVAQQRREPESLLSWTERRIRMRKECPELGWGDYTVLRVDAPEVLAIRHDFRGVSMPTLHNFSSRRQSFAVDPEAITAAFWSTCSTKTTAGPRAACTRSRFRLTVLAGTG